MTDVRLAIGPLCGVQGRMFPSRARNEHRGYGAVTAQVAVGGVDTGLKSRGWNQREGAACALQAFLTGR